MIDIARGRAFWAIGVCSATVALAACGSSNSNSSASSQATGSTSAFPAAVAANAKFTKRPTSIGITTPVGKPIPKGKVIYWIQCGAPVCKDEGDILQKGTTLLGWKLTRVLAGSSPESIANAYQKAVDDKPDAVVGSGTPSTLFQKQLKELDALHIPVVSSFNNDTAGNGILGVIGTGTYNAIDGKQAALYMLANSKDKNLNVGSIVPPQFPTNVQITAALFKTIKQYCPSCGTKTLEVPVTSIGSDLPSRIASFLRANPDITWLEDGYNDMVVGVPTALKGAGVTKPKLVTLSMSPALEPYIKNKDYLQAAIGTCGPDVYWRDLDLLARYFTGQPTNVSTDDTTIPYWTITADNIPSNADQPDMQCVVNYQQQFKKLWGLG